MCSGERPVLLHKFFHGFAISDSFLTVWDPRQKVCIGSCRLDVLVFFSLLFFYFRDEDIFYQFSISFPFFESFFA